LFRKRAADATGFTAEIILTLLQDKHCAEAIASLVEGICNNTLHPLLHALINTSKAFAFLKDPTKQASDPGNLRTLGCTSVLSKIAGKMQLNKVKSVLIAKYGHINAAVGVPAGIEVGCHKLRARIDTRSDSGQHMWVLKLDASKAYDRTS
jgi:hypothetical protein